MKKDRLLLSWQAFLSIPKTLLFNLKYLPLKQAIKLPILVKYNTQIISCHRNRICIPQNSYRFMIKLGFGENPMEESRKKNIIWLESGEVRFYGKTTIGQGFRIRNRGKLEIGSHFYAQQNCTLWCVNEISIGQDVLLGWNVFIRDHDGHYVTENGSNKNENKPVSVGNHVWICSESCLLKGVTVRDDSVIGFRSLVTKNFDMGHVLVCGQPAKIVRNDINWIW